MHRIIIHTNVDGDALIYVQYSCRRDEVILYNLVRRNIIRRIAKANNCGLVDLRKTFLEYDVKNNPENKESGILTTDRVHLNDAGNALVADEMLKAVVGK